MGKCTFWNVLTAYNKYDGSKTAHQDVVKTLNKNGHHAKMSDAWCTQTIMAALYDAGGIDTIGGYSQVSDNVTSKAKKIGIWHNGITGVRPGDIIVYCDKKKDPNHTEFCVGYNRTISGNYNGGCSRRTYKGRSVLGYVRPNYNAVPAMNDLQITICAAEVILGTYGSGDNRKSMLAVFGQNNAKKIQQKVNEIILSNKKVIHALAISAIAGYLGKNDYRAKRLFSWNGQVQTHINEIYSLKGKTIQDAAQDVISNKYGTGEIRVLLLKFCGYDPAKVQEEVNKIIKSSPQDKKKEQITSEKKTFCIHAVHFFKKNESEYGDCTAIYQRNENKEIEKCILIDCAKATASSVVIEELKKQGVKQIDALFISHAHGDHYGGLSNINKALPIKQLYLPDCTELDKYQKTYGNNLRRQAKKILNHHYLKAGDHFKIGEIEVKCLFIAPANKLKQHDSHHFVNNESMALQFILDGIIYHTAGDMSNPANNLMIQAISNLKADIFKLQWHGDGNAINEKLMKAIQPKYAFSNYHHKERSGRGGSRKKVEAVGGKVYRNWEDGDIFFNIENGKITVTTSK